VETTPQAWLGVVALLLGLGGGTHCALMCGGIAGALARAEGARDRPLRSSLLYSVGRITSYSVAGALAGALGHAASIQLGAGNGSALRVALGILMIVVGIAMAGSSTVAPRLEALGRPVWRRLSPLVAKLGPADRAWKLVAMGSLWGWLPCGLVYTALAASLATASVGQGALFMLCFGAGTLPWLLTAGALAGRLHRWLDAAGLRRAMALLVVCYGLWTLLGALGMASGGHSHGHEMGREPSAPHHVEHVAVIERIHH
jgi:sulfite exporter TauE/SafE